MLLNLSRSGRHLSTTHYTSYAPIPPGSSDGIYSLAYVAVVLPAGAAVDTFTASLWASDGTTKESVPITLVSTRPAAASTDRAPRAVAGRPRGKYSAAWSGGVGDDG